MGNKSERVRLFLHLDIVLGRRALFCRMKRAERRRKKSLSQQELGRPADRLSTLHTRTHCWRQIRWAFSPLHDLENALGLAAIFEWPRFSMHTLGRFVSQVLFFSSSYAAKWSRQHHQFRSPDLAKFDFENERRNAEKQTNNLTRLFSLKLT